MERELVNFEVVAVKPQFLPQFCRSRPDLCSTACLRASVLGGTSAFHLSRNPWRWSAWWPCNGFFFCPFWSLMFFF